MGGTAGSLQRGIVVLVEIAFAFVIIVLVLLVHLYVRDWATEEILAEKDRVHIPAAATTSHSTRANDDNSSTQEITAASTRNYGDSMVTV